MDVRKRVLTNRMDYFVLTNLAILFILNLPMRLLGFDVYLASQGQDMRGFWVFTALFGMIGACLSLALSKPKSAQVTNHGATNDSKKQGTSGSFH